MTVSFNGAPTVKAVWQVLRHYLEDLQASAKDIAWVGYLSTTSVYGDWGGALVDEEYAISPAPDCMYVCM